MVLKELTQLPSSGMRAGRLFPTAYQLSLDTQRSLYDCLYLALAEAVDGMMVTADRRFYTSLTGSSYGRRVSWVEDLPQLT